MIENIKKHVLEAPNEEICGVVIIFKGREKYIKCRNISENNTQDSFVIHPEDLARAEDLGELKYIVHSHTNTPPVPSSIDLEGIESSRIPWLIISSSTLKYTITNPVNFKIPLIGVTFKHGTSDCYSLIERYYQKHLDITLPRFIRLEEWWHKGEKLYRDNFEKAGFVEVSIKDIKVHDCIISCNGATEPNHAMIYLGGGKILHHAQNRLSSIDELTGYWFKSIWKVVRYKDFL